MLEQIELPASCSLMWRRGELGLGPWSWETPNGRRLVCGGAATARAGTIVTAVIELVREDRPAHMRNAVCGGGARTGRCFTSQHKSRQHGVVPVPPPHTALRGWAGRPSRTNSMTAVTIVPALAVAAPPQTDRRPLGVSQLHGPSPNPPAYMTERCWPI